MRQSCKYGATRRAQWRIGLLFPNRQARKPLSVIDGLSDVQPDSFVFGKRSLAGLHVSRNSSTVSETPLSITGCAQPRPIRAQRAACLRHSLGSRGNTLRGPRTRRNMSLEGSSTCADHTTTNKIRSERRSAAEQPRFRGSNRMLPTKGGRFTPIRARNAARAGPGWFRPPAPPEPG
jgi:hypothetical protein